jgi:hypothetical protein
MLKMFGVVLFSTTDVDAAQQMVRASTVHEESSSERSVEFADVSGDG